MLLVHIEREALLKPFKVISSIVGKSGTLPILSNILLSRQNQQLNFLATDLEIQVSTQQENAGDDFSITLPAKKFQDILSALPEGVSVKLEQESSRLIVKAGKSRFQLQTLPANDFPQMALEAEAKTRFNLPQKVLRSLIAKVQFSMAIRDIRYYLNGMLLVTEGGRISLVTTDGHRLAYVEHTQEEVLPTHEIIVPRKTVVELYRLLGDTDEPVQISVGEKQLSFFFDQTVIHSKVVDGKFPDYQRVIPVDATRIVPLAREQMLASLQRMGILSNEKFRGVRLVLSQGKIKIVCTNSEQEEADEELEVSYTGDPIDLGFNIDYLIELFSNLSENELDMAFGASSSNSCLITVKDSTHFKYVVMPMRI